jgi:membrane associated rhomboid family serine protease
VSVFYWFLVVVGTFWCPSMGIILCYIILDVLGLVMSEASGVAYVCHVMGAVMGITVAVVLLLTRYIESTRGEENLLQAFNIQE